MQIKLFKKVRTLFKIIYWFLIDKFWYFLPSKKSNGVTNTQYSIGIVTYINRYEKLFKPLIKNLCKIFPDTEIIIVINGYYNQEKQTKYLKTIGELLSRYPNIKKIEYQKGESLSKLWNQIVLNSSNEKVFICNDDIKITPNFKKSLEKSGILSEQVALMNKSWSHFLISKSIISINGWFDERFPGVGNEDEDYETRLVFNNILIQTYDVSDLKNIVFQTKDFSYAENSVIINSKYIKENKIFFDKKWATSTEKQDGYMFVRLLGRYAKLNDGMETPIFYPEINYTKK